MPDEVVAITVTDEQQAWLVRELGKHRDGYGKRAKGGAAILRKVYDALPVSDE